VSLGVDRYILDEPSSTNPTLGGGDTLLILGYISLGGKLCIGKRRSRSLETYLFHE